MRGISYENFHLLLMNINSFLKLRDQACPPDYVTVSYECTVAELVSALAAKSAHRAWLKDPTNRLKGLVTLTDFLKFIVQDHAPGVVKTVEKQ
jgi:CBS-domain-containing membrane protein